MDRFARLAAVVMVTLAVAGCGGGTPTPVGGSTSEQKGKFGVFYLVSVARPVGGTIKTADGRLDCGTVGSGHDLCSAVSFDWGVQAVLSAYPDAGVFFQSWAGDCGSAVALEGCKLDTVSSGADKFVAAIFNPQDRLGHARIPAPEQHSPLFFDFIKKVPGTPQCTRCHGADYNGLANAPSCTACHAAAGKPNWLQDCTFCHGFPPASTVHASVTPGAGTSCYQCHPDTVLPTGSINAATGKHMNGFVDASCTACHGFPPATGAHLVHFGLTEAEGTSRYGDTTILQDRFPTASPTAAPDRYAFGCGNCHPIDIAEHSMGSGSTTAKVRLYEASAPAGSLKARNAPTAAFDAQSKTCGGVYCHSSGQATPAYVAATQAWNVAGRLACNACHANPPRYASGGASTATANSHLQLADDGYEWGHFLGLLGPFHTSKHGGGVYGNPKPDANPITCETCHFDTTDPASRGPSGVYWLDTTGNYNLPGGAGDTAWQATIRCDYCHAAGNPAAPVQQGRVLPLRHVNGRRDVVFDGRTGDPLLGWVAAPNNPVRPYWMTNSTQNAWWDRTFVDWRGTTVEYDLTASRYDPATKTCTNVACHLAQGNTSYTATSGRLRFEELPWGKPFYYYTTDPVVGGSSCTKCHRT